MEEPLLMLLYSALKYDKGILADILEVGCKSLTSCSPPSSLSLCAAANHGEGADPSRSAHLATEETSGCSRVPQLVVAEHGV